jgi:hypothetical protein
LSASIVLSFFPSEVRGSLSHAAVFHREEFQVKGRAEESTFNAFNKGFDLRIVASAAIQPG